MKIYLEIDRKSKFSLSFPTNTLVFKIIQNQIISLKFSCYLVRWPLRSKNYHHIFYVTKFEIYNSHFDLSAEINIINHTVVQRTTS